MNEGWRQTLRYLRHTPRFWSSDVAKAVVAELELNPGEVLLDVGAGMGSITFPAVAKVGAKPEGRVIVAEPNPAMYRILQARRLLLRADRLTVEIHQDGFDNLPAADDYIDVAVTLNVMHHVPNHEHAAAELARVIKPGGRLLIVDEDFTDSTHPFYRADDGHSHDHDHDGHDHGGHDHGGHDHGGHDHHHGFAMIDVSETAQLLIDAGFASAQGEMRRVGGFPSRVVSAVR